MKRIMMLALAAAVTVTSAGALNAQGKDKDRDRDRDRGRDKGRTEVTRHPSNGRRVGPSPYGPGRRVGPWGARGILQRRTELRLTKAQIVRLNAIQRRWDDRNRLLIGRSDADEALRQNREAERKEVDAVLTAGQRSKAGKD